MMKGERMGRNGSDFRKFIVGSLTASLLFFMGCGSGGSSAADVTMENSTDTAQSYASDQIYEQTYDGESGQETEEGETSVPSGHKLIKNVSLYVETEEFDKLLPEVEHRVDALGGYIEKMNLYNGSSLYAGDEDRKAVMTIRIPQERLEDFVTEVSEKSNVITKDENVQDVTLQYADLESYKKALMTEQERLLELLGQAETMEDIIALEERLAEVRYELEAMESQLRIYDNQVDYSTVDLEIIEVERLTPVEEASGIEKMTDGFMNSLKNLFGGLKNIFIGIVILLPYIIFWTLLVLLVRFIIRKIRKNRLKKQPKDRKKAYGSYGNYGNYGGYGNGMYGNNISGDRSPGTQVSGSQTSANQEQESGKPGGISEQQKQEQTVCKPSNQEQQNQERTVCKPLNQEQTNPEQQEKDCHTGGK